MKEFPPFKLDLVNQCLWRRRTAREDERVILTPKAFGVLQYLVDHAGRLVTQAELLDALWPDAHVQPEVLKSQILDIRNALGDHAKNPLFIETLPRRGYQFIAAVTEGPPVNHAAAARRAHARLVGRNRSLDDLRDSLRRTLEDERQVVFITGEPGIGKTALVDEFQRRAAADFPSIRIARGQCVEGYGGKEPYYPMLEALGELCRGTGGTSVVQALSDQAPTWLVQFPALLKLEDRQMLQREILGATRDRMLREIDEALKAIAAANPLLLILEDMQWVDPSTVDLISALARGRGPVKLMLIATYRPVDMPLPEHPLGEIKQDLLGHRLCREIALEPLGASEVAAYLSAEAPPPEGLAGLIHRRSEGNPLFMVAALDHMTEHGYISRHNGSWQLRAPLEEIDLDVPESLRQMIEARIARLTAREQQALEAASIAGTAFSVCVIVAATKLDSETFEELCEELSRRQHLVRWVSSQELPDGSTCERFEFVHALYREVFYRRRAVGARARLHRLIGERLEQLFADRLSGVAPELAHHFEESSQWARAVKYLRLVAETSGRRYAHREAAAILKHALDLLSNLPEAERSVREIEILEKLATTYVLLFDPRAIEAYETLIATARRYGLIDVEVGALIDVALPLASISTERYLEVLEQALRLSANQTDPITRAKTRATCLARRMAASGWSSQDADECRNLLAEIRRVVDRPSLAPHLIDQSLLQWLSSEYREAHRSATEGLEILMEEGRESPYLSVAHWLSHRSLLFLGEWGQALRDIEAAIARVEKNGDAYRLQILRVHWAWMHFNAMDFGSVLSICAPMLGSLPPVPSPSGMRLCRILAGSAEVAMGNHDRALVHLVAARESMDCRTAILDWYWRMPLQLGLTELWLAKGDLAQARPQADQFLQTALATAERTWQALAWDANARVAVAESGITQAQHCVGKALQTMEGFEVPLAAWRVHATAAGLCERAGDAELAARHRALARATILKLANSMDRESPLRKTFLSATTPTS